MAITTYSELQTAIPEWMGRPGDANVEARVTDFIHMFERWFCSRVRVRRMLTNTTLTVDAAEESLPADFLEVRNMHLTSANYECDLIYKSLDWIRTYYAATSSGVPQFYTINGSNILFAPGPSSSYSARLDYYGFTALSVSAPTNWLLTYYPHVYLAGSLAAAHRWANDIENALAQDRDVQMAVSQMESEDMSVMAPDAAMAPDIYTP